METARGTPFSQMLSLNNSYVTRNAYTARTTVDQVATHLMRLEVLVTHASNSHINTQIVCLVADR